MLEEVADGFDGFFQVAFISLGDGGGFGGVPFFTQGFDDGGEDKAFDVGAGCIVRA